MKRAIVLAGGLPQVELINKLKMRGYYTILVDYAESPLAENAADKFYKESTLDIPKVIDITKEEKADIIITCCTDQALATVAVVANKFNLPCYIDEKTGWFVTDKEYMKDTFSEYGIPTAQYTITENSLIDISLRYPLVVKPVDCNSSKGVTRIDRAEELCKSIDKAIDYSRVKKAVIEEYIEGREISVDAFCIEGKVIILSTSYSEKIDNGQGFVIWKGTYPAVTDEKKMTEISEIASKIAEAFKLKNCPLLIQLIENENGLNVIEFSARTGGCLKYRMIKHASNIDIIDATIDLFEEKIPTIVPTRYNGFISDEFIYCTPGVFDHLENADECIKNGWASEIYALKKSGESVGKINNSGDRVAALVIEALSYEEYVQKHNKVAENIQVIDIYGNDIMRHDCFPTYD